MPARDNPLRGSAGPAHCETADGVDSYNPDANCYASDGSCAVCDAGYVPVDSFGGPLAADGSNPYNHLTGAYTCCATLSVRPGPRSLASPCTSTRSLLGLHSALHHHMTKVKQTSACDATVALCLNAITNISRPPE